MSFESDDPTSVTYLYAAIFLSTVLLFGLARVLRLSLLLVFIDSYVKYVNKLEADYERRCLEAAIEAAAAESNQKCSFPTKAWNYCLSFYTDNGGGQCPLNRTMVLEQQRQFHQVTGKLEILIKFTLEHLWMVVDEVTVKVFSLLEKIVVGVEAKNWFQWIMLQFRATVHDNLLKPVLAVVVIFTIVLLIIFKAFNLWRFTGQFLSYFGLWHLSIDAAADAGNEVPIKGGSENEGAVVAICRHCNGSGKLLPPNQPLKYVTNVYYVKAKKKAEKTKGN